MESGSQFHQEHGQLVWKARLLKFVGWMVLLFAIILLAVALTMQWLS